LRVEVEAEIARLEEADNAQIASVVAAAEAQAAELGAELAATEAAAGAALASAAELRRLVRDWTLRMRSAEVARTSDAVRLAVLESQRGAAAASSFAVPANWHAAPPAEAGTEDRGEAEGPPMAAALDAARREAAGTREALEAAQARLVDLDRLADELARAREQAAAQAAELEAEHAILATTLVELDEHRQAAQAEAAARVPLAEELAAEREAREAEQRAREAAEEATVAREAELAEAVDRLQAAQAALEDVDGLRTRVAAVEAERDAARNDVEALRVLVQAAEEIRAAQEAHLSRIEAVTSVADRVAALERAPAAPAGELAERAGRLATQPPAAAGDSPLAADLDAAAAALRSGDPRDRPGAVAAAETPDAPEDPPAREPAQPVAAPSDASAAACLRCALVELARDDPPAAAGLLAGLLPAQAGLVGGPLSYDLTIEEAGTFAVTISRDGAVSVGRVDRARSRRTTDFRVTGSALALSSLLAGRGPRPRRFRSPVRVSGRRARRLRSLSELPRATRSLPEAIRAGASLEPGDVLAAFPYALDPAWTRGHAFTIAQEVVGHGVWTIAVADGAPITVERGPAPDAPKPDAAVTYTRAAFDAMLSGEPPPPEEPFRVRGDLEAVALLRTWIERALGHLVV
jgi:hypothetical protein